MVTKEIVDYVVDQLKQGVSREEIKAALLASGWQLSDVDEAFKNVPQASVQPEAVVQFAKPAQPTISIKPTSPAKPVLESKPIEQVTQSKPVEVLPKPTQSDSKQPIVQNFGVEQKLPVQQAKVEQGAQIAPVELKSSPEILASETVSAPQDASSSGGGKTLRILVFILVGVLVIAGGAYAYLNYLPEKSPEAVVESMFTEIAKMKSLEYSGAIQIETASMPISRGILPIELAANQTSTSSISFNGVSDIQDLDNANSLFSLNANTNAMGAPVVLGLEVRSIAKIIYLKLNAPAVGQFDLASLKDQWIKVDLSSLTAEATGSSGGLSAEQEEALRAAIHEAKIIDVVEKFADEKIDGTDVYHYKFQIDKEGIMNLSSNVSQITNGKDLSESEKSDLRSGLESMGAWNGEVWIGKNDYLPYRLLLGMTINKAGASNASGKFSVLAMFKNFNKPVSIETPTETRGFAEVFMGLILGAQTATSTSNNILSTSSIPVRP